MFAWAWIISLLVFSALGALRTRRAPLDRYATFICVCAVWWATIPIATGEWVWSLLFLPLGLGVARVLIRRRAASRAAANPSPPAI